MADLNRALAEPAFGSFWRSVVPQAAPSNKPLYRSGSEPSPAEVAARIGSVYEPYHAALQALLERTIDRCQAAWLLDLHSYQLPDHELICLGDANGSSCDEAFIAIAEAAFSRAGFTVQRNKPFNGGHITRRYAAMDGVQSLQIEATYNLYLNRAQIEQPMVPDASVPELRAVRSRFEQALREVVRYAEGLQGECAASEEIRNDEVAR